MNLELREILELKKENIQESKDKNVLFKILTPFIKTDTLNKNDRLYPEDVTAKAIKNFGEKIKNSKILSQVNHPMGVHPDVDKVSHIVDDINYNEKDKRGYVKLAILNTTAGRDLKTIVNAGVKLGVSLRGKGTVEKKEVQKDFEIFGIDVVSSPSFGEDATFTKTNVFESYNSEEKKNEKKIWY